MKSSKEPEKISLKEEDPVAEEPELIENSANNSRNLIDEDELIIKDELDNDCFEEVDRIGDTEKEVNNS